MFPEQFRSEVFAVWDSQVTEATSQWGCSLGADMTAVVEEILAEQLLDSYERAAILAGRLPRAGGRRQPLQCQPEDLLISSADDPEHPDREQGLQSLLLDATSGGAATSLRATLCESEDWEGIELLEDLAHPDQDHRWLWGCGPPSEAASREKSSGKPCCSAWEEESSRRALLAPGAEEAWTHRGGAPCDVPPASPPECTTGSGTTSMD